MYFYGLSYPVVHKVVEMSPFFCDAYTLMHQYL